MAKLKTSKGVQIWIKRKHVMLRSGMVGDVKLPMDLLERRKKKYPSIAEMIEVMRTAGVSVSHKSIFDLEKGRRSHIGLTAFVTYLRLIDLDVRVRNVKGDELPDEDLAYPKRKVAHDTNEELQHVRHLLVPAHKADDGSVEGALKNPVAWVRKTEPVSVSEAIDHDPEDRIVNERIRKSNYRKRKEERDRHRSGEGDQQPGEGDADG